MTLFDRLLEVAIIVVLIIGGYQFYFWAQRQTFCRARCLVCRVDAWIEYDPRWVWVYAGLYYPMIVLAGLSVPTWRDFAVCVGAFLALLAAEMAFFLFWPTAVPADWRSNSRAEWVRKRGRTWSQSFLDLVWSIDALRNSCPSMHVSVATMVDLVIWREWPLLGMLCLAFPALIAISAVRTKQHFIVDVVPGAALGVTVFHVWYWAVS